MSEESDEERARMRSWPSGVSVRIGAPDTAGEDLDVM